MKARALLVCLVVLLCVEQITASYRIKSFLLKQKRERIMGGDHVDPDLDPALQLKITDNNPFVRKIDDDALKPASGDTSALSSRLQKLEAKSAIRQAYETVQDIVHDVLSHNRHARSPSLSSSSSSSLSDSSTPSPPVDGNLITNGAGQTPDASSPALDGKVVGDTSPQLPPTAVSPIPAPADPNAADLASPPPVQQSVNPNVPPEPLGFDPENAPHPVLNPVVHPGVESVPESKAEEIEDNAEQLEAQTEQDAAAKIATPEGALDANPVQEVMYPVTVGPADLPAETTRSVIVPGDKPPVVKLKIPPNTVSSQKVLKEVEKDAKVDDAEMEDIARNVEKIDHYVPHHIHAEDQ